MEYKTAIVRCCPQMFTVSRSRKFSSLCMMLSCDSDDPAGNSFMEGPDAAAGKDLLLSVEHYARTPEQTREIGLSTGAEAGTADDGTTTTPKVVRKAGC